MTNGNSCLSRDFALPPPLGSLVTLKSRIERYRSSCSATASAAFDVEFALEVFFVAIGSTPTSETYLPSPPASPTQYPSWTRSPQLWRLPSSLPGLRPPERSSAAHPSD